MKSGHTLRENPPREINFFTKMVIVFSGFFTQFGLLFFAIWLSAFFVLFSLSEASTILSSDGDWTKNTGIIEKTYRTIDLDLLYKKRQ